MCSQHDTISGMQTPDQHRLTRVVGNRIRETRQAIGVSQHDLSELAEVHITSLSRIERGITMPKLDMLARIAIALDTSVSELVKDITHEDVYPKRRVRYTAADFIRAREAAEAEAAEAATEGATNDTAEGGARVTKRTAT